MALSVRTPFRVLKTLILLLVLNAAQIANADTPETQPEVQSQPRTGVLNMRYLDKEELRMAKRTLKNNRKACRRGDAEACLAAGKAYQEGVGVGVIGNIAEILFNEACDADLAAGCRALGTFHAGSGGQPTDMRKAGFFYERACDLGDLDGCQRFASLLRTDLLGPPDYERSNAIIERACRDGSSAVCIYLADLVLANDAWSDEHERAIDLLDAECNTSILKACERIVRHLKKQPYRDEWRIGKYQHQACYLGRAFACDAMGTRAYDGVGIAPNRGLALSYYDKACKLGTAFCETPAALRAIPQKRQACGPEDMQACAELGLALAVPASPEFNFEEAVALLEQSCLSGLLEACSDASETIARHRAQGDPDWSPRFVAVAERACENEDLNACNTLARAYTDGGWAQPNPVRAATLLNMLCDEGNVTACKSEQQFSGVVAEARMAVANEDYLPPVDADKPTTVPQEIYVFPEAPKDYCVIQRERFRGKTYTQKNCPPVQSAVNSYRLRPGQAPWQALLWRPKRLAGNQLSENQRVLCGGSVIAKGWILTAAHCLTDNGSDVRTAGHRVRLGVYNPQKSEGVSFPILRTIKHPSYDKNNKYVFDIALVQYDHRAGAVGQETNSIAAIRLDPLEVGKRRIANGMNVYSYGWGWTQAENSRSTDYLQGVKMRLRSEGACTRLTKFRGVLRHAALCAGGQNFQQTCYGDSGGPLVFYGDEGRRPTLIGVVSAGKKCGATGRPSQYTRVAKAKSWIAQYVSAIQ